MGWKFERVKGLVKRGKDRFNSPIHLAGKTEKGSRINFNRISTSAHKLATNDGRPDDELLNAAPTISLSQKCPLTA